MYCVGGVARKLFTSQKVMGSNPAGCKVNFFVLCVPSRLWEPGLKVWAFCPGFIFPVPKPGQKGSLEPGQMDVCVVVSGSAGEGDGVEEGMDGEAIGFCTFWIAK